MHCDCDKKSEREREKSPKKIYIIMSIYISCVICGIEERPSNYIQKGKKPYIHCTMIDVEQQYPARLNVERIVYSANKVCIIAWGYSLFQ